MHEIWRIRFIEVTPTTWITKWTDNDAYQYDYMSYSLRSTYVEVEQGDTYRGFTGSSGRLELIRRPDGRLHHQGDTRWETSKIAYFLWLTTSLPSHNLHIWSYLCHSNRIADIVPQTNCHSRSSTFIFLSLWKVTITALSIMLHLVSATSFLPNFANLLIISQSPWIISHYDPHSHLTHQFIIFSSPLSPSITLFFHSRLYLFQKSFPPCTVTLRISTEIPCVCFAVAR